MSALLSFGLVACFREAPGVQGYLFPFNFYLLHFTFSLLIIAITTVIIIHKVFFIIPCLDVYQKIDMRTSSYDVPPQEVCCLVLDFHHCQRLSSILSEWKQYLSLKNTLPQILTKDSVTVFVNAIMYYKVKDHLSSET